MVIVAVILSAVAAVCSALTLVEVRKGRLPADETRPEGDPSKILREWLMGGDSNG